MKLRIFAEDKPAEKVFEYQLEIADQTILLSTALLSGSIALAGLSGQQVLIDIQIPSQPAYLPQKFLVS